MKLNGIGILAWLFIIWSLGIFAIVLWCWPFACIFMFAAQILGTIAVKMLALIMGEHDYGE